MMASRILSRFLPNAESEVLERRFQDVEGVDETSHLRYEDDHELNELLAEVEQDDSPMGTGPRPSTWHRDASMPHSDMEDDVPGSLLMEDAAARPLPASRAKRDQQPPASRAEEQWRRAQDRQPLYVDINRAQAGRPVSKRTANQHSVDARDQALWLWTNVQNLDAFLLELYEYYVEHGIWSMLLARIIHLATTGFLFALYMFLSTCIDYSKVPASKSTSEVLVPKCMQNTSFVKSLLLWLFTFWWVWMLFKHVMSIRRLWALHEFYHHLLGIPDTDLQTVSWERVVEGLMKLRNANVQTADHLPRFVRDETKTKNQSRQRMDAHDIANRLMRRDNYLVALVNKEIFDLSLVLPFIGNRQFYSKSLESLILFCFEGFIFDHQGQVKPSCLRRQDRDQLIETLRRRLRFTAIISILMAPINIGAHCVYYFSRYYAEFRNSPAKLSARAFTPLAEWKFREFNELTHDFKLRMRMSAPFADDYLNQFPKDKTHQLLQFVSLISGTLAGLLGLATLLDPELFLGFEITPGRTAFFYISILMAIFAGARGGVPDENEVHDPVLHLMDVMEMTHYQPTRGRHHLHSNDVKIEFSSLYQMKLVIFIGEIMSLAIAPFILWKNSGKRSETIIDFFRNSTVQVDGLGYLCAFSVFDFRKSKNVEDDARGDMEGLREEYFGTKDDKMAKSQFYFMQRVGQYDQKHGASGRHHRSPHYGMHLPPSFPPMSPLRQAAGKRAGNVNNHANPGPARASSPARSVLLDLPQHHVSNTAPRRTKKQPLSARGISQRRNPAADDGDDDNLAQLDAMTTSRLIEEDNSLADSWKTLPRKPGASSTSHEIQPPKERGPTGVLGLLGEYAKAHTQGNSGRKIG